MNIVIAAMTSVVVMRAIIYLIALLPDYVPLPSDAVLFVAVAVSCCVVLAVLGAFSWQNAALAIVVADATLVLRTLLDVLLDVCKMAVLRQHRRR